MVLGRLKDAALPLGGSVDARAYRLLAVSVQRAAADTELLAADTARVGGERSRRLEGLAAAAHRLAAALAGSAPALDSDELERVARDAESEGDLPISAAASSLEAVARAVAVLRGVSRELPAGLISELPGFWARVRGCLTPTDPTFRRGVRLAVACAIAGLIAELSGLGRPYWAVSAVVVVLNAPAAQSTSRALMRIVGTILGFACAIPLLALTGSNSVVSLLLGLLLLLPGLLAIPINYAVAVTFITCAVALLFASGPPSDLTDFLQFRVLENAIGVATVCVIGLLLWRTATDDWWVSARGMARSLARAYESPLPSHHREDLLNRTLQLRTETIEVAAMPEISAAFSVAWSFLAGAENLIRILLGSAHRPVNGRAAIAARLRAVERACEPQSGQPVAAASEQRVASTLAEQEVDRMAEAVIYLRSQG